MNNLLEIFCDVDDFCLAFMPEWEKFSISNGHHKRRRAHKMTMSEMMTLIILFHRSHCRDFKNFYKGFVPKFYKKEFPKLLSYHRFIEIMPSLIMPLSAYFYTLKGKSTGIQFVDSTSIKACHSMRIPRHRTFCGIAMRGKSSMGWFYGFKLHLIVDHKGEIIEAKITSGNVHDTQPVVEMAHSITNLRKNMKARTLSLWDRAMLSRRFIIETIIDQLKNISQIEHSRHRSVSGFIVNILGGLIAYLLKKHKPRLNITEDEEHSIIVA